MSDLGDGFFHIFLVSGIVEQVQVLDVLFLILVKFIDLVYSEYSIILIVNQLVQKVQVDSFFFDKLDQVIDRVFDFILLLRKHSLLFVEVIHISHRFIKIDEFLFSLERKLFELFGKTLYVSILLELLVEVEQSCVTVSDSFFEDLSFICA